MSEDEDGEVPEEISTLCDALTEDEMPMCSSPAGHQLNPVNDEKGGPQTRMVCIMCDASRPVRAGDLDRYAGEYPEWVEE